MSKLPDPFKEGMARGWKVMDARSFNHTAVTCDVAIIGSGAGGAVTAELLSQAGLDVMVLEEGPLKTSSDFWQNEAQAYADLYQENATRQTVDRTISILQGRCVGGSTVVNWTTSFRTPAATLHHWQQHFGLKDYTVEHMRPHFEAMEERLHVKPWEAELNANNRLLETGLSKLGIEHARMSRNVKGCWNLGSCGLGCPVNAKQSMLITTIPGALESGARLLHHARAERFRCEGGQVAELVVQAVEDNGAVASQPAMRVRAKHYVLAAGGINSPALLLRSEAPDPHELLGKRTFLHPVAFCSAVYGEAVHAWAGAPQTAYSDAFMPGQQEEAEIGFKIEANPLHPGLTSILLGGVGHELATRFAHYPNTQMLQALLRDGFHPESTGGRVILNPGGSPGLYYPLKTYVLEGIRRAFLTMARIQFAAGATQVLPMHDQARYYTSLKDAEAGIASLDMSPYLTGVGSAHVMGGCGMGSEPALGVVQPDGQHWQLKNLSVHDGSVFPTSIGANPQLSVYGVTHRLSMGLIQRLREN